MHCARASPVLMQFTLLGLGEDMPGAKCANQLSFVSKGARTKGKQAGKGGCLVGALGRELQQTQEDSRAGAQGGDRGGQ